MAKPTTLKIDEVEYVRKDSVKQLKPTFIPKDCTETPFMIGEKYFIRTVTYHVIGELSDIKGNFLVFDRAAWVADSGEFTKFLKTGIISEVEIMEDKWFVNINSIADSGVWVHNVPTQRV